MATKPQNFSNIAMLATTMISEYRNNTICILGRVGWNSVINGIWQFSNDRIRFFFDEYYHRTKQSDNDPTYIFLQLDKNTNIYQINRNPEQIYAFCPFANLTQCSTSWYIWNDEEFVHDRNVQMLFGETCYTANITQDLDDLYDYNENTTSYYQINKYDDIEAIGCNGKSIKYDNYWAWSLAVPCVVLLIFMLHLMNKAINHQRRKVILSEQRTDKFMLEEDLRMQRCTILDKLHTEGIKINEYEAKDWRKRKDEIKGKVKQKLRGDDENRTISDQQLIDEMRVRHIKHDENDLSLHALGVLLLHLHIEEEYDEKWEKTKKKIGIMDLFDIGDKTVTISIAVAIYLKQMELFDPHSCQYDTVCLSDIAQSELCDVHKMDYQMYYVYNFIALLVPYCLLWFASEYVGDKTMLEDRMKCCKLIILRFIVTSLSAGWTISYWYIGNTVLYGTEIIIDDDMGLSNCLCADGADKTSPMVTSLILMSVAVLFWLMMEFVDQQKQCICCYVFGIAFSVGGAGWSLFEMFVWKLPNAYFFSYFGIASLNRLLQGWIIVTSVILFGKIVWKEYKCSFKTYHCSVCGYKCGSIGELNRHKMEKHSDLNGKEDTDDIEENMDGTEIEIHGLVEKREENESIHYNAYI